MSNLTSGTAFVHLRTVKNSPRRFSNPKLCTQTHSLRNSSLFWRTSRYMDWNCLLTGRYAPKEMIEAADLVTEMKEVKHSFNKGYQARKGIEY